jgi:uracil-DNA glycosylase family 4
MSLNLDKRQRAMLREMGVRVWQPLAPLAEAPSAIEVIAARADSESAEARFEPQRQETKAFVAPVAASVKREAVPARTASPPAVPISPPHAEMPAGQQAPWRLGEAQSLYAQTAQAGGARWLVLAQTTPAALHAPAFEGDAGRLLDNMLRAARLHQDAGAVLFAPLVRQAISGSMDELLAALSALVERMQPDVVLVMGRLAAQALLQSTEPFGKLRGQLHALHGRKTVVTYDAPYLLRCPADKAKAWDDLCLAMSLAACRA